MKTKHVPPSWQIQKWYFCFLFIPLPLLTAVSPVRHSPSSHFSLSPSSPFHPSSPADVCFRAESHGSLACPCVSVTKCVRRWRETGESAKDGDSEHEEILATYSGLGVILHNDKLTYHLYICVVYAFTEIIRVGQLSWTLKVTYIIYLFLNLPGLQWSSPAWLIILKPL